MCHTGSRGHHRWYVASEALSTYWIFVFRPKRLTFPGDGKSLAGKGSGVCSLLSAVSSSRDEVSGKLLKGVEGLLGVICGTFEKRILANWPGSPRGAKTLGYIPRTREECPLRRNICLDLLRKRVAKTCWEKGRKDTDPTIFPASRSEL